MKVRPQKLPDVIIPFLLDFVDLLDGGGVNEIKHRNEWHEIENVKGEAVPCPSP